MLTIQNVNFAGGPKYHFASRTLSLNEAKDALGAAIDPAGLEPQRNVLFDLRDLRPDHPVLGTEELKALVTSYGSVWARATNARAAIVVSREVDYGMARMGQILMDRYAPNRMMVFRSLCAAHRWLEDGAPQDAPSALAIPSPSSTPVRLGLNDGGTRRVPFLDLPFFAAGFRYLSRLGLKRPSLSVLVTGKCGAVHFASRA